MAEFVSVTPQVVLDGESIIFQTTTISGGCSIRHRDGSGHVTLKGGSCCNPARYRIAFHGNVTGFAGAIAFEIFVDGERLPETLMNVVAVAATNVLSIDAVTEILVEGGAIVGVRNVSGEDITVNTAALIVNRTA